MARLMSGAASLVDAVLASYSQVLFNTSRWVGLLLLAATLVFPASGLLGLLAVLLSMLVVRVAGFSPDLAAKGLYGYNALLAGLAVGAFVAPLQAALLLLPVVVVAVVFVQTALESAIGSVFNLPVLSLPFVLVTWLLLAVLPFLRGVEPVASPAALTGTAFLPAFVNDYLRALGAVFFAPDPLAGALVALALLLYSRIGFVLSLLGFAVAFGLLRSVLSFDSPMPPLVVAYNAILVAIALGGVWFVPQRASFVFALVAVVLTALVSVASVLFLLPLRLPVLILPFNLVMFGVLYAMRQRVRDASPKSVDFIAGPPEVNLNYFRTRIARFGSLGLPRLALPFSGRWVVTQGVDGSHTHQGLWRYALDFEVRDSSGRTHAGDGRLPKDYHCYRLPVTAPADGTVVKVVNHVPDNAIGERNPADPWGNLVVIQHGYALYSLLCHLSTGSIEVSEGQFVRRGARLGLCGNSGRSFVPHLHFQVQSTPRVGAPTRELELYDIICGEDDAATLHRYHLPVEGEAVRNLEGREEVADAFSMKIGSIRRFRITGSDGRSRTESATVRIDLYNNVYLESDSGDRLFFENQDRQFLAYDYQGRRGSVLFLLYAAAPRVPFEVPGSVAWDDVLPLRHFRPRFTSWSHDVIDPFVETHGLTMSFSARRAGRGVEVTGRGVLSRRPVATGATFEPGSGPTAARLEIGRQAWSAELTEVQDA